MRSKNLYIFGLSALLAISFLKGTSQQNFLDQLPQKLTYDPAEVVDSVHGIVMYERLNHRLSLDSTRNCKGYACDGSIKDYYNDGKLLHNGYYVQGQLASYTNYYPSGTKERVFTIISDYESEMNLYYPTGQLKSRQVYYSQQPMFWKDYYSHGELSYHMEYDNELGSHIIKRMYNDYGVLTSEMYLSNKKKLLFRKNSYYESGVPSTKGILTFDDELLIHIKNGKWLYYYPNGKVSKIEVYKNDEIVSVKEKEDI
jgi:antitoxin component YwqK of YwqJK toxin-antitoxin module